MKNNFINVTKTFYITKHDHHLLYDFGLGINALILIIYNKVFI